MSSGNTQPATPARERAWYPILYMFALTFGITSVLVGIATATRERVETNRRILFEEAVVSAAGIPLPEPAAPARVHALYTAHVQTNAAGTALSVVRDGQLIAHVLPFEGQGFWNTIRGALGVAPDRTHVTGFAVYEQNETPGLGGEITKPHFREQFKGLRLADGDTPIVLLTPGQPAAHGNIDAITGATQTCRRLEDILNNTLMAWRRAEEPGDTAP